MGWGGTATVLMAGCLADRGAGAVRMRTSVGWGSFDPSTAASWPVLTELLRTEIKRLGVVLLGLLVYTLLYAFSVLLRWVFFCSRFFFSCHASRHLLSLGSSRSLLRGIHAARTTRPWVNGQTRSLVCVLF